MLQRTNNAHSDEIEDTMPAAGKSSGNSLPRHPCSGSALTRRILPKHVDGRTAPAKRLAGLVQDLAESVADSGNPLTRARLVGAALLIMQQEALAHALAAGKVVNPDDVVRVHNACERALKRLS